MTKAYNPLLDGRKNKSTEMNASDNILEGSGPLSPVSGRRMVRATISGIPVWVDQQARLVLPVKKGH